MTIDAATSGMRPRVFISYAHDNEEHENVVRKFYQFLRQNGFDASIDLPAAESRQDWSLWMQREVDAADFVLVVASPEYKLRAEGAAVAHKGWGVQWEAALIRELFSSDREKGILRFLPVVVPGQSMAGIPIWLGPRTTTHYVVSDFTVEGAERLIRYMSGQPYELETPIGALPVLPPSPPASPPVRTDRSQNVLTVDELSPVRDRAAAAFTERGMPQPDLWTRDGLKAHRIVVATDPTLKSEDRACLSSALEALNLALSAQELVMSMVEPTAVTEEALRSAHRAATKRFDDPPIVRQFDLFHDVASHRVAQHASKPVEGLVTFVAKLAYACKANPRDKRLFAWADAHGLEANEVNRILEFAQKVSPVRRLVIDFCNDFRLADGDFPEFASAQIFEDGVAVGDRITTAVAPANIDGALAAVAALVDGKSPERVQLVDVVVPDSLVLLDPAAAPFQLNPRRKVDLGSTRPVSVRVGGRFRFANWDETADTYRALTKGRCAIRLIASDGGDEPDEELLENPAVVVFDTAPDGDAPSELLLDAIYATPIVLWPVSEVDASGFMHLIEECWPDLRSHVRRARWLRAAAPQHKDILERLRMVWEDDQWLTLARKWERYG